tara:strand:- start:499 stop:891 length:393 start_codon:yes stop_codon:yes gene_type:complete
LLLREFTFADGIESKLNRLHYSSRMEKTPVIRMWITNKNGKKITSAMSESMTSFLTVAVENGCIGSTFAEDEQRVIVFTRWSDEMTLEEFRTSKDYHTQETKIIQSFADADFDISSDILFNSTARVLYNN